MQLHNFEKGVNMCDKVSCYKVVSGDFPKKGRKKKINFYIYLHLDIIIIICIYFIYFI